MKRLGLMLAAAVAFLLLPVESPLAAAQQVQQGGSPAGKAKKVWTNDDFPEQPAPKREAAAPAPAKKPPQFNIPYYPSPENVVDAMLQLAELRKDDVVYDLGSGDGRIVIAAAKQYGVKAVGIEIDPKLIKQSEENARKAGVAELVTFRRQDLFQADISEATVVTMYLLPAVNLALRPKLLKELKPGSRVIAHNYGIGRWGPDKEVYVGQSRVFHWVIPAEPPVFAAEETEPAAGAAGSKPAAAPPLAQPASPEEISRLARAEDGLQRDLSELDAERRALKAQIREIEEQRNACNPAERPAFDAQLEELRGRLSAVLEQVQRASADLAAIQTKKGSLQAAPQPSEQTAPSAPPPKTPNKN